MKIKKQWVSWEEFEKIQGGTWTPAAHTHEKVDITDTPWAWADVLKTGSNLTDLATRQHAGLTNITANQHHAQTHSLVSHTARDHHHLIGLADDDHSQYHNDARGDARYYTKTQLQTSGQSQVHWGNITNTPTAYIPEHHFHIGKDTISHHLTDLNDDRDPPGDPFDVLSTGDITGQGSYDWFGTWANVGSYSNAEIVVLSGEDKMLRLIDSWDAQWVGTELTATSGKVMVTGVVEFEMRQNAADKISYVSLNKGAALNFSVYFWSNGQIRFQRIGGVATDLKAYSADTWYKIRIHFDCVARQAVIFIDNVFNSRQALNTGASGAYVDKIRIYTNTADVLTLDINNLKVFNLTI